MTVTSGTSARIAVMGTYADVVVHGDDAGSAVAAACAQLQELEQRWSRFIPESEISRLNTAAGSAVRVSPATIRLVELAVHGHAVTGGAFDPTVLGDLERAGYDRTFASVGGAAPSMHTSRRRGASGIVCDDGACTVRLPRDVGFDAGGIGKGLAADLVIDALVDAGMRAACVNIGGDAHVFGMPWRFEIQNAASSAHARVHLSAGAIATSSTALREWRRGDRRFHHLIDPRTGRPTETDITAVTVIAARSWQSEVLTKAVFVLGAIDGVALIDELGAAALLIGTDGTITTNDAWARFEIDG